MTRRRHMRASGLVLLGRASERANGTKSIQSLRSLSSSLPAILHSSCGAGRQIKGGRKDEMFGRGRNEQLSIHPSIPLSDEGGREGGREEAPAPS